MFEKRNFELEYFSKFLTFISVILYFWLFRSTKIFLPNKIVQKIKVPKKVYSGIQVENKTLLPLNITELSYKPVLLKSSFS